MCPCRRRAGVVIERTRRAATRCTSRRSLGGARAQIERDQKFPKIGGRQVRHEKRALGGRGHAGREGASSGGEEVAAELRQGTAAKASARDARTLSTSSTPVPLISAAAASDCPRAERTKEASRVVVSSSLGSRETRERVGGARGGRPSRRAFGPPRSAWPRPAALFSILQSIRLPTARRAHQWAYLGADPLGHGRRLRRRVPWLLPQRSACLRRRCNSSMHRQRPHHHPPRWTVSRRWRPPRIQPPRRIQIRIPRHD